MTQKPHRMIRHSKRVSSETGVAITAAQPPRLQKQLHAKATEIRETWDGMATVTLDETTGTEFDRVMGRGEQK